jgi:hypothetical protein
MNEEISCFLEDCCEILEDKLGFEIPKSDIKLFSNKDWGIFLDKFNLDRNSQSVYFPLSKTAFFNGDHPFLKLNIMHEVFGHGVFFEYSGYGLTIKELEKEVSKHKKNIENTNAKNKSLTKEVIDNYNLCYESLINAQEEVKHIAEGFSMWVEHELALKTKMESLFEEKFNNMLNEEYKKSLINTLLLEKNYGLLALFGEMQFPLYYTSQDVSQLLTKTYSKKSINLGILYGSKKSTSDIDVLLVSDNLDGYFNNWLDIRVVSLEEFNYMKDNLDITVSDPLFSGELILGSKELFDVSKKEILETKITEKAIKYNLNKSREYNDLFLKVDKNIQQIKSYEASYLINAKELNNNNKILVFSDIKENILYEKVMRDCS